MIDLKKDGLADKDRESKMKQLNLITDADRMDALYAVMKRSFGKEQGADMVAKIRHDQVKDALVDMLEGMLAKLKAEDYEGFMRYYSVTSEGMAYLNCSLLCGMALSTPMQAANMLSDLKRQYSEKKEGSL